MWVENNEAAKVCVVAKALGLGFKIRDICWLFLRLLFASFANEVDTTEGHRYYSWRSYAA